MRIAFYAPMKPPGHPAPSGDRKMARHLMSALGEAGHDVTLASDFRSYDGTGDKAQQERLQAEGEKIAEDLIRQFAEEDGPNRPDIWFTYHLYHKAPDWLGPAISQALGIPYMVAEASYAPKQADGPWRLGHEAVAAALGRADTVFGLNAADAECVLPLLADPGRWVPLAPFLDPEPYFQAAERQQEYRSGWSQRLDIDAGVPWILAVAMMRPGDKLASYRILGDAMAMLTDRNWQLIVAGDGEAEADVRRALADIGERTRFLPSGPAVDLPSLYAACDIYAWPSVNEAYGMALLEAQSTGLPVVAADVGGVGGIVARGTTGLLIDEPEAKSFAAAVAELLNDEDKRRTLARNAKDHILTAHTVTAAARTIDAAIQIVAGEK
jgi:glycosyltransferase involved in cell wall biosynthesis